MVELFPRVTPEEVGIHSHHISNFLTKLDAYGLPLHSVIMIRKGKIAVEAYYSPYEKDTLHRMFSVTKSFTSLGIGLLAAEGKLALDDPIIRYFPDKLPPQGVHPYIEAMTIRDLLMMATAHERTTYKRSPKDDWVQSFFVVEPSHHPGTLFSYDTSSSHTLAALVEKLSGLSLLDYLRSKFLNELDFSPQAYVLTDPQGTAMGGSGLMATPLDLAKVAWVVLQGGVWQGKQLLPAEYVREAIAKQIDTSVRGGSPNEQFGYGYQFWRVDHNGWAMLGMGGQLAVGFPDQDFLLVTTADIQEQVWGSAVIFDTFFTEVYAKLTPDPIVPDKAGQARLNRLIQEAALRPLAGKGNSGVEGQVSQGEYTFAPNRMGLEKMRLEFMGSQGKLYFTNGKGEQELAFGRDCNTLGKFPFYGLKCATSGAWLDESTLAIKSYLIDEEIGSITILLGFKGSKITVLMKKVIGTNFSEYSGFAAGEKDQAETAT